MHVPTALFRDYWTYGYPAQLQWFRELVRQLRPRMRIQTDAPQCVEIALRTQGEDLLVHFVNGNPGRDLAYVGCQDLWIDDIPPIGPIVSRIACPRSPSRLTWEPGGRAVEAKWRKGELEVTLPRLEIHTCLRITP